ncbi:MAG: nucleoside kinase [bacterium]|nr:nucleoside kinase [bacterium]
MDNVKVKINNEIIEVSRGTTLEELSKKYQSSFKHVIILAKVNGMHTELTETIKKDCEIEFLDLTDRGANRVFLNGLIYLTIYAAKNVFGLKNQLKVNHSLDKGLYIETSEAIIPADIVKLEEEMKKIVAQDLAITKVAVTKMDAMDYFNSIGDTVKAEIMKYVSSSHVNLYKLGDMYNYFYNLMPINTKCLTPFELTYLHSHGFVLRFLTIYMEEKIKPFEQRENIFKLYQESRRWAKNLELENVVDLNKRVSNCTVEELIQIDELIKNARLLDIAKEIATKKDEVKIVLIAGPSSTGKTTTTNKLVLCLKSLGLSPIMLSMDDYFVDRKDTPLDEEGNPDFERLETLDLTLFEDTIEKILSKKETIIPTYNFITGEKEYKEKINLKEEGIILIEGIHALNPRVLEHIPKEKKLKIYLSPLTEINIDEHTRISTTDNRLLRRIIRDNRTRGNKVEKTLESWAKVRAGEEKYIFPYQDDADITYNTSMLYEVGVLKTFVEPLLYSVSPDSPYYNEAIRLINFLKVFLPISSESISKDSILREFIGGGCFKI